MKTKTKAKPRSSKPRQLSLFDPKPEPKIKARWKQPRLTPSERHPQWAAVFVAPATEDVALRKRVLGW